MVYRAHPAANSIILSFVIRIIFRKQCGECYSNCNVRQMLEPPVIYLLTHFIFCTINTFRLIIIAQVFMGLSLVVSLKVQHSVVPGTSKPVVASPPSSQHSSERSPRRSELTV